MTILLIIESIFGCALQHANAQLRIYYTTQKSAIFRKNGTRVQEIKLTAHLYVYRKLSQKTCCQPARHLAYCGFVCVSSLP